MSKLKVLPLLCSALLSYSVCADETKKEDAPDPGNHTKLSTQVTFTYGKLGLGDANDDFFQIYAARNGVKANGNYFLGTVSVQAKDKGKFGSDDFNVSQFRTRYFEVTPTGWKYAPMFGYSLDYLDTSFTDGASKRVAAAGGVLRMVTPFKNWLSFPNLALAVGQNDDDFAYKGFVDEYAFGWQFNYLNTIYLNKNGANFQVNPQFTSLDMGGDVGTLNSLQMEFAVQVPLTTNRKHWAKVTYNEYFDDAGQSFGLNESATELKFTYAYYL